MGLHKAPLERGFAMGLPSPYREGLCYMTGFAMGAV